MYFLSLGTKGLTIRGAKTFIKPLAPPQTEISPSDEPVLLRASYYPSPRAKQTSPESCVALIWPTDCWPNPAVDRSFSATEFRRRPALSENPA